MNFKETKYKFMKMFDSFRGEYKDLTELSRENNLNIIALKNKPTYKFRKIKLKNIQVGRFYLINYNFNGNNLYCPILSIDYRVSGNKHIMFALNLDYLPMIYKRLYFNKLYDIYRKLFERNNDMEDVLKEIPLPINFEQIYKSLKDNGNYQYAISAYDITKINECFLVSTDLLLMLLGSHMSKINVSLMKENMKRFENTDIEADKLKYTISELEKMEESYNGDTNNYYRKLKQLESNYKLFEND